MRILLLNSEYPPVGGGAGNASANIATRLTGFGHNLHVLTAQFRRMPPVESRGGLTVQRIQAMRRRIDRSGPVEQVAFMAAAFMRIDRLIREARPDVILAFFGMPSGAIAWRIWKRHRIPYVVSLRGGDVPGFRPYDFRVYHKLIGPVLRVIWRGASAVVANSSGLRDLANAFEPRIEIPIIPNGVDLEQYALQARSWAAPRLLSVGRLVYQKGLDIGLRALAGLKELDWEWNIAGDGPQMAALREQAHTLGLEGRVRFLGWQTRDELRRWYDQSSLFVFPSRHEGMPNAVLEAMACGLPVVATRVAGNEELVADGRTGCLVGSEDADALRDALRRLLTDADRREQMGRAARKRVEEEYSWDQTARQYEKILEEAMKNA